MQKPDYHIFVCSSSRINGLQKGFCVQKDAPGLMSAIVEEVQDRGMNAFVTNTGCFGICEKGPIVVVYPQGDWYGNVTSDDVEELIEAIEEGETLERLAI